MNATPAIDFIPHRPPFVMVDEIVDYDEMSCRTRFTIRTENPLVDEGRLLEAGLAENIAQSCASKTGYKEKTIKGGKNVQAGVIAQIKDMNIERLPRIGETIETFVHEEMTGFFNMTILTAEILCGTERIATGTINVVETNTTEP